MRRKISGYEITTQQLAVLMRLKEQGEVSQNNLGRMVGTKPATIHGISKRLETLRLIASIRSPDDHRLTLLALTKEGDALADKLQPLSDAASSITVEKLSSDEQVTLKKLLDKLISG